MERAHRAIFGVPFIYQFISALSGARRLGPGIGVSRTIPSDNPAVAVPHP
jgi:hypothetical protein